jgi:hypothetical protein
MTTAIFILLAVGLVIAWYGNEAMAEREESEDYPDHWPI